jgi:iron complex outermembrane recepter protein
VAILRWWTAPALLAPLLAYGADTSTADLKRLSVEELMNIEVTSVSRTTEALASAAAAVAVLTNEEIRRSGATTVPEALRYVPGLHVARNNASSWAIGSRGFTSVRSEKLLVLSDTRSIYTPLFSGVLWDVQDYLLEDIARIEAIRGPGAALWGSNAVNGVINITTKAARDTQGLYLEAGGGTEERAFAGARYGGRTIGGGYFRVFSRYFERDESFNRQSESSDDWHSGRLGFRVDWDSSETDTVTLQGDAYRGTVGQLAPSIAVMGRPGPEGKLRVAVSGGNVLGRWRHQIAEGSDIELRAYYDRTRREDPSFDDDLSTADIELQHRYAIASRHEITWGLGYRHSTNRNEGKGIFAVDPETSRDELASGFVQDQIAVGDTLQLTLGSKLEHNDFSGFEIQPSVRAAWDFSPAHTLWGAVSRAVRVPTRLERDVAIDVTDPQASPVVRLLGNEQFNSEKMIAYELGFRWRASTQLFFDLAAFHNRYRELASLELDAPFTDPRDGRIVIPLVNQNLSRGHAVGFEALVNYSPFPSWRLSASYSTVDVSLDAGGFDLNRGTSVEGSTPRHQMGVRSLVDLPGNWEIDAHLRALSAVRTIPEIVTGEGVPGYTELDLRLGWRGWGNTKISLVGSNLLHRRHPEFGALPFRGEAERSGYGKLAWEF